MDLNWSLKELYDSFESESFKNDLKKLQEIINKMQEWVEDAIKNHESEKQKLEDYLSLQIELLTLHEKLGSFSSLTLSVDSNNSLANKYDSIIENKMSDLAASDTKMSKWISEIKDVDSLIKESKLLEEHSFILKEIIREQKHMLEAKEEMILAKMQNTGASAWETYKNLLIANHKVKIEVEGEKKELPLTEVLNMAYAHDKVTREKAYHSEIASYKKVEEGVAAALNAIKGEALTICKLRGYESPLDMTLQNARMDKETLEAMLEAIKENLPLFRKYLRLKAEKLGYKKGLPFYELYAPVVNKEMRFSYEEAQNFVEKNFRSFSDHLADFARTAMDKHWIDVMPKEGKVGGAFCAELHSLGESRVMLNFDNSFGGVVTMAHELGHGFHDECLKDESILNINMPMSIAETASTFCETLIKKAAVKEADKEEALAILETELCDCTQVIVDIYSRFLFESKVFEKREEGPLSVAEINELMLQAQREAYGDGLDPDYLHQYMWTWKPHYYSVNDNFYNFPYAFGLLFARGLYAKYEEDKENFPKKYEELLKLTGKMSVVDILKTMNIDASSIEFWRGSLRSIEEDIKEFNKLIEEVHS